MRPVIELSPIGYDVLHSAQPQTASQTAPKAISTAC